MMKKKELGVIVACYNSEKYIKRCLDSLVNQTRQLSEIIIVDDGSYDGSRKIINKYAERYGYIKLIEKENEGTFHSRIDGMKLINTDYVGFIDADDYWVNDAAEKMIGFVESTGADIIQSEYSFFTLQK